MQGEIKICATTRAILKFSLIWPPKNCELNPGKYFYWRVLILVATTSVWCFCVVMHLVATVRSDLSLHMSEDVSFVVVFCGLYYATFNYVRNQQKVALLMRDLSNFENFGTPPGFEETDSKLNLWSKLLYAYATLGGIVYNLMRIIEDCEEVDFDQVCGLLSPFWVPFSVKNHPFLHCVIFVYVVICSQMLIKVALMISYNASEVAQHIVLRINHLKMLIVECFDGDNFEKKSRNLKKCVLYHSEILEFASRLDDCFSTAMFAHLTMTSAIFACIEKQFVDIEHQLCAVIHFIGWFLTLFVACVGGQNLINASQSIPEAIWLSKWYNVETRLLKDLIFMLMRSQRNLKITAGPFGVMSYALLISVLKMSYSILCMLTS